MRPDKATCGASPKSAAPAGAIVAICAVVDENVDGREAVEIERPLGWQRAPKHARLL